MVEGKWTNNDLQNTIQKPKGRATRTPLKPRGELMFFRRASSSFSTSDTRHITLVTKPVISHE